LVSFEDGISGPSGDAVGVWWGGVEKPFDIPFGPW